jgi:hypothetical protein
MRFIVRKSILAALPLLALALGAFVVTAHPR